MSREAEDVERGARRVGLRSVRPACQRRSSCPINGYGLVGYHKPCMGPVGSTLLWICTIWAASAGQTCCCSQIEFNAWQARFSAISTRRAACRHAQNTTSKIVCTARVPAALPRTESTRRALRRLDGRARHVALAVFLGRAEKALKDVSIVCQGAKHLGSDSRIMTYRDLGHVSKGSVAP